ncbi:MAG: LysR family transcriptional regulator [Faecalibacterium sp.]|nr:LysR family transcriptional regulator [Faecalibacterium sp.]
MTIQQLRYFLALCQDLNYTRTAERLYLSRQALRLSIAALENELCGPLFINVRNHLALTEKGQRFRAQAAPVVEQFDRMCAQAYQDIRSPALRLGISVALVPNYLPMLGDVLEQFRQQYPGIPLETTLLSNDAVCAQLQNGTLDAGLVMDLGGCAAGLARTALSQHTAAVMVCRSSPFWEQTHITPAELDGQTLLVPGFAPDALAPLWQALRESSAHPQLELVEQFYQVLYRTQEQNCVSLNRFEEASHNQMSNVRDVALDGLPPICAGFLRPQKQHNACAELLCRFLQERLKF